MTQHSNLYARLVDDLKAAMRARAAAEVSCLRQVKSRLDQVDRGVAAGAVATRPDDQEVQDSIRAYRRALMKASDELAAAGERSRPLREKYAAECALLCRYLPPALEGEALTLRLRELAADLGIVDARGAGRLLGALLRARDVEVDPPVARRAIDELLGSPRS